MKDQKKRPVLSPALLALMGLLPPGGIIGATAMYGFHRASAGKRPARPLRVLAVIG